MLCWTSRTFPECLSMPKMIDRDEGRYRLINR